MDRSHSSRPGAGRAATAGLARDVIVALVVGLGGTAAFTAVRSVQKRRFGAQASVQPIEALAVGSAGPDRSRRDARVNTALHWGYGISGGVTRLALRRGLGLDGGRLLATHFALVWLPWRLLAGRRRPAGGPNLALDGANHLLYAATMAAIDRVLRWDRAPPSTASGTGAAPRCSGRRSWPGEPGFELGRRHHVPPRADLSGEKGPHRMQ
jgi:hypothetical protein